MLVPGGAHERPPFDGTRLTLAWNRPDSWWHTGTAARPADLTIITLVTPIHVPAYLTALQARGRRGRTVVIAHNVMPHEARPGDRLLVTRLLRRADGLLVHAQAQADVAASLDPDLPRAVVPLPVLLPSTVPSTGPLRRSSDVPVRLLFFGIVRPYKGLDLLLHAMAKVPGVRLTVAGEFWSDVEETRALVRELGIEDRVEIRAGYVAAEDIPALFADHDVMVLPYRSATASANFTIARTHGLPIVATRVGDAEQNVDHGVDGLLCEPDDVESLSAALRDVSDPAVAVRLQQAVTPGDDGWARYLDTLTELATRLRVRRD
jgi:glycosyltransferase involved in cell wall biosynthesis